MGGSFRGVCMRDTADILLKWKNNPNRDVYGTI